MKKKESYGTQITKPSHGILTAEEDYVTQEQLDAYEEFVLKYSKENNISYDEANEIIQEKIKSYYGISKESKKNNADKTLE